MNISQDIPSSSVQLCPLCGKPFTSIPSYNRHVSYCRRTQDRIRNRRKSCRSCSNAKAKCTFQAPCARCTMKGIECTYDSPSRPELATANMELSFPLVSDEVPSAAGDFVFGDIPGLSSIDLQEITQYQPHGWFDDASTNMGVGKYTSDFPMVDDVQLLSGSSALPFGNVVPDKLSSAKEMKFLARLRTQEPLGRHSGRLVLEALCAIPEQMLRRETLPPFIHGHWNRPTMPEPLAVCMRIAQMFASRTPEITPFIWRTILAEQKRILRELPQLSQRDLLAAIQAGMVYLIMRVVDGTKTSHEWNQQMALSQSILCDRFLDLSNGQFCQDEMTNPSTTWEEWIFAESRRRTSSVWFLITRTFVVKTKDGCPTAEQPWMLPLPSPKLQWEARSQEAWLEEMGIDTPVMCSYGDLMESRRIGNEKNHAHRLDSWNARTDNLGSLLNIAVAVV